MSWLAAAAIALAVGIVIGRWLRRNDYHEGQLDANDDLEREGYRRACGDVIREIVAAQRAEEGKRQVLHERLAAARRGLN